MDQEEKGMFFLQIVLLLIWHRTFCQKPIINSVTKDGSTVIIRGTNFGTKERPLIYDNFENYIDGELIDNGNSTWKRRLSNNNNYPIVSSMKSLSGTKSVYSLVNQHEMWQNLGYHDFEGQIELYGSLWIWMEKYPSDGTYEWSTLKWPRFNSGTVYSGTPSLVIFGNCFPSHASNTGISSKFLHGTTGTEADSVVFSSGVSVPYQEWHRLEMYMKLSNPAGIANGEAFARINGRWFDSDSDSSITWIKNYVNRGDDKLLDIFLLAVGDDRARIDSDMFQDNVFIGNTLKRVEIGDESNFHNCTVREVQYDISWVNSKIEFSPEKATLDTSRELYVFVLNENEEWSDGYPIRWESISDDSGDPNPLKYLIPIIIGSTTIIGFFIIGIIVVIILCICCKRKSQMNLKDVVNSEIEPIEALSKIESVDE